MFGDDVDEHDDDEDVTARCLRLIRPIDLSMSDEEDVDEEEDDESMWWCCFLRVRSIVGSVLHGS